MPKKLLSPEEVASILRVNPGDVLTLIEERCPQVRGRHHSASEANPAPMEKLQRATP